MPHAFQGRSDELGLLDAALGTNSGAESPLISVDGIGGVGKTALAVAWANRQRPRFTDGILVAELRHTSSEQARQPAEVLAGFLRSLGVAPGRVPTDLDDLVAAYRTALADRAVLVVLDDATSEEQVRPLRTSSGRSATLVTSRSRMTGLAVREGAQLLTLGPLTPESSQHLVEHLVGRQALAPGSAARIAAACGHLPLALRLASHRIAADASSTSLRRLLDRGTSSPTLLLALEGELNDARSRLSDVFAWAVEGVNDDAQQVIEVVARLPLHDTDEYAIAASLGTDVDRARAALTGLRDRNLLESSHRGRFAMHEVIRGWTLSRTRTVHGAPEPTKTDRWIGYFLHTADRADRALVPSRDREPLTSALPVPHEAPRLPTRDAALRWWEHELQNLVEATRLAATSGDSTTAAQLPFIALGYFNLRKPWHEWIEMFRIGISCGNTDARLAANLQLGIGIAYRETGHSSDALAAFARAARGYKRAGDQAGQAMTFNNMATCHTANGDAKAAIVALTQALTAIDGSGEVRRAAIIHHNLAEACLVNGHLDDAGRHAALARTMAQQAIDFDGAASSLLTLARIHAAQRRPTVAEREYLNAIAALRKNGDRHGEAVAHKLYAELLESLERAEEAGRHRATAAVLFDALGDPRGAALRPDPKS